MTIHAGVADPRDRLTHQGFRVLGVVYLDIAQASGDRRLCAERVQFLGVEQAVGEPVLGRVLGGADGDPAEQVGGHHRSC